MRLAVLAAVLMLVVGLGGCRTQPVQPAPPPPPPAAAVTAVRNAKKVFVLNGGEDSWFQTTYPYDQLTCYNELYTALTRASIFQLVQDPADADLTVTIEGVVHYESVLNYHNHGTVTNDFAYDPAKIVLSLLPRGAQEPVYTMSAAPSAAKTDPEKKQAIAGTIVGFVNQLEVMAGATPAPISAADLIQSTAPIPNKVLTGKRVFVMDDPSLGDDFGSGAAWVGSFSDDLKNSNRCTVVSSAHDADLVLQLSLNTRLRVRVLDGPTMNQLWTFDDPTQNYSGRGKTLMSNEAAKTAELFLKQISAP